MDDQSINDSTTIADKNHLTRPPAAFLLPSSHHHLHWGSSVKRDLRVGFRNDGKLLVTWLHPCGGVQSIHNTWWYTLLMAFTFLKYAYVEEEMSRIINRNHMSIGKNLLDRTPIIHGIPCHWSCSVGFPRKLLPPSLLLRKRCPSWGG